MCGVVRVPEGVGRGIMVCLRRERNVGVCVSRARGCGTGRRDGRRRGVKERAPWALIKRAGTSWHRCSLFSGRGRGRCDRRGVSRVGKGNVSRPMEEGGCGVSGHTAGGGGRRSREGH